jgi:hypothetical protein
VIGIASGRQLVQQHWRANAPVTCSSSLPASVLLIDGFDQHPSKPHKVGVGVGDTVRVGVLDGAGVYVLVGGRGV